MATRKRCYTDFGSLGPSVQNDGTVASGTAGEINLLTMGGIPWEQFIIGTQTTLVPSQAATGVDIVQTDTNGQGMVLTPYSNSAQSPLCFTIGGPAFFAELEVLVTDTDGCRLMFGFHGGAAGSAIQGHQAVAAFGDYTDLALIGQYAGGTMAFYTQQCINDTAPTDTDTTIDPADTTKTVWKLRVNVSAAGVVSYALSTAATATPTTFTSQSITSPAAQTFDDTDIVVPMILTTCHTNTASNIILRKFTCGFQD